MKEKIYTIPVIDSFKESGECPFCNMYNTLEKNTIQFVLGPSYMETDIREQTNKLGFCNNHLKKMYSNKNRLGLALMLNSHLDQLQENIDQLIALDNPKSIKKFFSKKESTDKDLYTYISKKTNECYICKKISSTFDKFIDTFFYLWKKDDSFIDQVKSSKGFCLNHFALIYNKAPKYLNDLQLKQFYTIINTLQKENLNRIREDLEWFIKKNDYRFVEETLEKFQRRINKNYIKNK